MFWGIGDWRAGVVKVFAWVSTQGEKEGVVVAIKVVNDWTVFEGSDEREVFRDEISVCRIVERLGCGRDDIIGLRGDGGYSPNNITRY